jgi:sterol desaturase/sphingolipid hydroxylase (fatty acid hydroxylase superfamily)
LGVVHDVLPRALSDFHELVPRVSTRGLAELANPARAPFAASERVYWLYLLVAVVLSFAVYIFQAAREASDAPRGVKGFFVFLFPKDTYGHRSAFVDFAYFITSKAFGWFLVAPFLLELPETYRVTTALLTRLFPHRVIASTSSLGVDIAFTVVAAIAADFGLFIGHWLMHKVPLLWEFHKVHHSAQVMTPITVYRQHPVDDILNISMSAVCAGITQAVFGFAIGLTPHLIVVLGLNVIVFAFYFFGFNLRHSHVWLSYGPTINKIFVSPAQHQIHHSNQPKHFDKNMGFILTLWDRIAGTAYIPEAREDLKFGLGNEEDADFLSLGGLYARPFINIFRNRKSLLVVGPAARAVLLVVAGVFAGLILSGHFLPAHDAAAPAETSDAATVTAR